MRYRPEVDGLRALAVLPVILFHAGFSTFSGGFVGVDMFFVISGYLITTIIVAEQRAGSFSLVRFYERRARRILPALFLIMLVTVPAAWLWLPPGDMKDYAQSLIAVPLFSSNVLFWLESGYFDTSAELKPLLHTWSLAVEEQYYVLFPLFLMICWRFGMRRLFGLLAMVGVISLLAAHWGAYTEPSATFFLLPTRGWELMIGALAALYLLDKDTVDAHPRVREWGAACGLALVAFSIFAFDEGTPFPSLFALAPTVGVVLIILFASQDTRTGKLLGNKVFVGIGLVSYSAYLWHQPLFAFARQRSEELPGAAVMLALSTASLLLAYLSWKFVEMPFRDRNRVSRKQIFGFAAIGSAAFIGLGMAGDETGGFKSRFDFVRNVFPEYEANNKTLQHESWSIIRSANRHMRTARDDTGGHYHFQSHGSKPKVLVVGNSHSKDMFNMFHTNRDLFQRYEFARYQTEISCLDSPKADEFFTSPSYVAADVIVVSTKWGTSDPCDGGPEDDFAGAQNLVRMAKRDDKLLVITSNTLEFRQSGSTTLADNIVFKAAQRARKSESEVDLASLIDSVNRRYYEDQATNEEVDQINDRLRRMSSEHSLIFLDKEEYLCDTARQVCFGITRDFRKAFYDSAHYTLAGATHFGARAHAIDWLRPLDTAVRKRLVQRM